jgi:putative nucleotidyltransferase with HDIG domain
MVVDDELWIAEVISEQLILEGFYADMVTDSSQVMDALTDKKYDLVILDIYMPPPNGLTLLKEIQKKYPFLPVLMLTAFSDAETATQAMKEGASDYIVKPYHSAQLTLRIERALERGLLLRERAQARQLLEQRVDEQTHQLRDQSKQLSQMLERVLVTYQATVKALEAALDARDQSAPGHCRRVAKLAIRLATRMGFKGEDLVVLEHGALLHDIGKLGVEDSILLKPGPLDEQEWHVMQKHPEIGCQIVSHIDFLRSALPIIRHHHEHYDGSGYPDGLKGEKIPILARIFSVVDAFDAQTHQRPYNVVNSTQATLENLRASKGTTFDPQVVDAFIAMIEEEFSYSQEDERILGPPDRSPSRLTETRDNQRAPS